MNDFKTPRKVLSDDRKYYYIVGLLKVLKGCWLSVEVGHDGDVRPMSDPRLMGSHLEASTPEEVHRYIRVMKRIRGLLKEVDNAVQEESESE